MAQGNSFLKFSFPIRSRTPMTAAKKLSGQTTKALLCSFLFDLGVKDKTPFNALFVALHSGDYQSTRHTHSVIIQLSIRIPEVKSVWPTEKGCNAE